jgi:hypothetical protein
MSDGREFLKLLPRYLEASEQRCVASRLNVRQTLDLIVMSREAIARSKHQIARLNMENRPDPPGIGISGRNGGFCRR